MGIGAALDAARPPAGWESLEQVETFLKSHVASINSTPQMALHGLTPAEASRLFHSSWMGGGPIRLREDLDDEPWDTSPAVLTALVVLREWHLRGVVRTTKLGRIPTRTVYALADEVAEELVTLPVDVQFTPRELRMLTADAIACLFEIGLLGDVKGGAALTAAGVRAVNAKSHGRFAAQLFDARLRVLAAEDRSEFGDLVLGMRQPAMLLRALCRLKGDRFGLEAITRAAWTPPLHAPQHLDDESLFACVAYALLSYLLPMADFGLVIPIGGEPPRRPHELQFELTPRFRRFVQLA